MIEHFTDYETSTITVVLLVLITHQGKKKKNYINQRELLTGDVGVGSAQAQYESKAPIIRDCKKLQ